MDDTLLWVGLSTALLAGLWSGYTVLYEGNLDGPDYQVKLREGVFELREYTPFVIATTPMQSNDRDAMSGGFRSLAGYIFGGNQPQEQLAMTVPVMTRPKGESLPMTAPVITQRKEGTMSFVMPKGRTLDDLPKPNSKSVNLSRLDWGLTAAVRYRGYATPKRVEAHRKILVKWIAQKGYQARSEALSAQYNSPFAMPLLRRNEMLLRVQAVSP
jgi:hypothetical protein